MLSLSKSLVIVFSLLMTLTIVLVYWFIPDTFIIRNSVTVNCNVTAAARTLNTKWGSIFHPHSDSTFDSDGYIYKIDKPVYNGLHLTITKNGYNYFTVLSLLPVRSDSSIIVWNATVKTGDNPFLKIINYRKAKTLQASMSHVLIQLYSFLDKTVNVYNYSISYTTLADTILASVQQEYNTYPSTEDIYAVVDTLKEYILSTGAKITNLPMMNVARMDDKYTMMIGLPIDREITPKKGIETKRLLQIKNKTLTAEVHGGPGSINNAHKQVEAFMQDHFLAAPVKSFDLLITDRIQQKDTAKWVTQLYYPIN